MSRADSPQASGRLWICISGFVFAIGLTLSGMTQPTKVLGFLDFAGHWDPSLALVMLGAVAVYWTADRIALRRPATLFDAPFPDRPSSSVDRRLVAGAAIFGVGWGLSGFCPGPALVSAGVGASAALWFVPAMIAGMALHDAFVSRGHSIDC
jgi:uncharacterized membrane protein YedE/YeeE